MEQFQTDLNSERAALQKMESAKLTLEKQVRETNDRPVTPCGFSAIFSVNGVPFVTLDFPWNQRQNHLFIPLFINFFLIYLFCQFLLLFFQNKDMKVKLAELESQTRARNRMTVQALENKLATLQEQLDAESK